MTTKPRDRLVSTALKLFCQYGFHATGIDTVLAVSGVAKTTLYRYFKSKDELILAALRKQDEDFRNSFMRKVERSSERPAERLLAMFDVYQEWSKSSDFYGCTFVNASAEFSDLSSPIHALCAEHKRLMLRYIQELAEAAGIEDGDYLAKQLMMLIDGATVLTQVTGKAELFHQAKKTAKELLHQKERCKKL